MKNKPVILFDGVCNFCNFWVNVIIRNDREKKILFAALQSETGKKLLEDYKINSPEILSSTVVLIFNGKFFLRSDAVLKISKILGGKWLFVYYFLKIIPKFFRDFIYNFIAKNRYRWFGKRKNCIIPGDSVKERFLH